MWERIASSSVAGPSRWRSITASSRGSQSARSRIDSVARQRQSRGISMTHRGRRRGRSRRATSGCAAAAAPTPSKGDVYADSKACHPAAIKPRWTREPVLAAMRERRGRHGRLPTSYDWSRTHAHRRGGEGRQRIARGESPAASAPTHSLGTWRTPGLTRSRSSCCRRPRTRRSSCATRPTNCSHVPAERPTAPGTRVRHHANPTMKLSDAQPRPRYRVCVHRRPSMGGHESCRRRFPAARSAVKR
jgi:hypothetical protein